jgi:hypothetical protein
VRCPSVSLEDFLFLTLTIFTISVYFFVLASQETQAGGDGVEAALKPSP